MGARLRATHGVESDKQDLNSTAFGRHVQVGDFANSSPHQIRSQGSFSSRVNTVVRQPYGEDQLLLTYFTYRSEICLRSFSFGFDRDIGNKSDKYYLSREKQEDPKWILLYPKSLAIRPLRQSPTPNILQSHRPTSFILSRPRNSAVRPCQVLDIVRCLLYKRCR